MTAPAVAMSTPNPAPAVGSARRVRGKRGGELALLIFAMVGGVIYYFVVRPR